MCKLREWGARGKLISRRLRLSELNRYSAEAAFYMIRSVIPLLALALVTVGRSFPLEQWPKGSDLLALLPEEVWAAVGGAAARFFRGPSFAAFLSIGAALTLWSAATGMRALCRATVRLTGGGDLSYTVAVFRGLAGAALFSLTLGILLVLAQILDGIAAFLLSFLLLLLFCICLTRIFLRDGEKKRRLWMQAGFTAGAWEFFSLLFGTYLRTAPRASYLYGGVGAILLFMIYLRACLWIYLLPFTLSFLPPRQKRRSKVPDACPHPSRKEADGTVPSKGRRQPPQF